MRGPRPKLAFRTSTALRRTDIAGERRRDLDSHEIVRAVEPATAIIILRIKPVGADNG